MSKPFPKQCEVPGCESADVALVVTAYEWRCHSHSGGNATPHPENTPVGRLVAENADLRAALAAAEAALADERRHADALAGAVREAASMCVRQVFPHATLDWVLKSHAVRRAAEVANG